MEKRGELAYQIGRASRLGTALAGKLRKNWGRIGVTKGEGKGEGRKSEKVLLVDGGGWRLVEVAGKCHNSNIYFGASAKIPLAF